MDSPEPSPRARSGSGRDPADDLAAAKAALRDAARAARRAITPEARELAAEAVAARVLEFLSELPAQATVLAYRATDEELDPASAVAGLRVRGVRIALPRVNAAGGLDVCEASEDCELSPGSLGIFEPVQGTPLVGATEIDAVLVPGVAFDRSGFRLGYGKGYYDQLLPLLRAGCLTVGLAFDEQLVTEVPHDERDVPVGAVATPGGVWQRT